MLMLVGGAMVPLWFLFAANMFGYTSWPLEVLGIALVVRILSGVLLCGLLTKVLGGVSEDRPASPVCRRRKGIVPCRDQR